MGGRILTIKDLFAPGFYRAWNDFYTESCETLCLDGGRGCVDGNARILTPNGSVKASEFNGGYVYALTECGIRSVPACRSIRYFQTRMFRVTLANGARLECTDHHRFLTPDGWKKLDEISEGDFVCRSSASSFDVASQDRATTPSAFPTACGDLQGKCCGECPSASPANALRLTRTLLSLIYRYWHDCRRCDGLLPSDQETYRDVLQRLTDAPLRSQGGSHEDDPGTFGNDSRICQCGSLLSTQGCQHLTADRCCEDEGTRIAQRLSELLSEICPSKALCQTNGDPDDSIRRVSRLLLDSTDGLGSSAYGLGSVCHPFSNDTSQEEHSLRTLSDMLQRRVDDESFSDSFREVDALIRNRLSEVAVQSIQEIGDRVFYDLFVPFYNNYLTEGGFINHNSCKSTTADTFLLLGMERDRRIAYAARDAGDKNWRRLLTHGACYRKVAGTLADSCFSQLQWSADKLGIYDKFIWRKTPLSVVRKGSNQRIVFRGLDDAQKSRSIKMPFGYLKYLHWEELTEFAGLEEVQDVTRSVQRGGHKFMTFYTYNPPETSSNWVNYSLAKLEEEDPLFKRYHTDYRSVPPEWLGEKFFRDAEILRRIDERQYRHVYLGEITGNGGTVFPRVKAVEFSDRDIARFDNVRWGADFGLRDPTTLIGLNYDKTGQRVQIFSEWYKTDATLDEIEEGFKRNHFGYEYIYGDCNAGTLITTLRAHGLPMLPSEKGKGSILNGIKGLQSMVAIEIDKRRCPHTYWEFVHMEYEKDKSGGFTGNIPPGNDHCIDPCRYALVKDLENFSPFG